MSAVFTIGQKRPTAIFQKWNTVQGNLLKNERVELRTKNVCFSNLGSELSFSQNCDKPITQK